MSTAWGNSTDRMLLALNELGRATRAQLQEHSGVDKFTAGQIITRLLRVTKRGGEVGKRRAHIAGWTREHDGARDYLRAVYAPGDGKDAKRPPAKDMLLVKREYWQRRKQRIQQFGPGADLQAAWIPTTTTK